MKKSANLVFFGTDDFSASALKRLILSDWNLAAVVTKPDSKAGRGQELQPSAVASMAKKANIQVFQPPRLQDFHQELSELKPTHGILASYGKIIPPEIINIFPGGIINIHPSLLPEYRGPAPVEATILNGDKQTGISLMKLTAGMDEGPIYAQKKVKVPPNAITPSFSLYLAELGTDRLMENLASIIDGSLKAQPQDSSKATYTKLLKKEDGQVDWGKPAEVIEREVRAYLGWPKSRAEVLGNEVVITKARVAKDEGDGELVMKAQPGWLEILQLIAPSGRTMSGADFLRGYNRS